MVMEDFIGFTYNGVHSSDLKIYRTSNGSRYDDNITATMTDKTVDVPGGDGQYYFGTTFKNRTFTVNYAFDNLEETDIVKIKEVFCGDGIHDLVFDEHPYKAWSAKVTGTASMKHLCFEEKGKRIYRGEGSITFTCYYPYAHTPSKLWITDSVYGNADGKNLSNYRNTIYTNINEWSDASGLKKVSDTGYTLIKGEVPTTLTITLKRASTASSPGITSIKCEEKNGKTYTINLATAYYLNNNDKTLTWNTKTGLLTDKDNKIIPISGEACFSTLGNVKITPNTASNVSTSLDYQALYR